MLHLIGQLLARGAGISKRGALNASTAARLGDLLRLAQGYDVQRAIASDACLIGASGARMRQARDAIEAVGDRSYR